MDTPMDTPLDHSINLDAAIKSGDPAVLLQLWGVTPPTANDVQRLAIFGHFAALLALYD